MKKSLIYTYLLLISLTVLTAVISNTIFVSTSVVAVIIGLSMVKFLIVAFQFMELKKANLFWKWSLSLLVAFICLLIIIF